MVACAIIGLPNVGKSTLFNALTSPKGTAKAEASNYPFCTIDPNTGMVIVHDQRLDELAKISKSKKIVYAPMKFVDIAGLVKGASRGEGLGNQFLAHIRECDALVQVVCCFKAEEVVRVGEADPIDDIETINLELALSDLQTVQNILSRLSKQVKGNKELAADIQVLEKIEAHLNQSKPVRSLILTPEEKESVKPYPFLTAKKKLYAANVSESDLPSMENEEVKRVREYALKEGSEVLPICAKLEAELTELPPEERDAFLASVGVEEPGLNRLIRASFKMLGLITYLTTAEIETRAWTINEGDTAYIAAGKIHSDIQKRFAKAEVIRYEDFIKYNGRVGAKEAGKVLAVGRDYVVKDGDIMLFL